MLLFIFFGCFFFVWDLPKHQASHSRTKHTTRHTHRIPDPRHACSRLLGLYGCVPAGPSPSIAACSCARGGGQGRVRARAQMGLWWDPSDATCRGIHAMQYAINVVCNNSMQLDIGGFMCDWDVEVIYASDG